MKSWNDSVKISANNNITYFIQFQSLRGYLSSHNHHLLSVDEMAAVPSDIYPHIYLFLLENKFVRTAKSFKTETLVVSEMPLFSCMLIYLPGHD